jgi:hypothetical protein
MIGSGANIFMSNLYLDGTADDVKIDVLANQYSIYAYALEHPLFPSAVLAAIVFGIGWITIYNHKRIFSILKIHFSKILKWRRNRNA